MAPLVRRSRRLRLLTTGAVVGAVVSAALTGCSNARGQSGADAHSSGAAAPAASTRSAAADLSAGLLPSSAFGPGAQVQTLSGQQLQQAMAMAGQLQAAATGAQVQPQACGQAVQQVVGQLAAWTDAAAEGAMTAGVVTGEALGRGGDAAALTQQLGALRTACSGASVTVPGHGTATVTAEDLPLGDVQKQFSGIDVSGVALTIDGTGPDGTSRSVPALAALVRDGDRVMALVRAAPSGASLDSATFSDLLTQAIGQQATLD